MADRESASGDVDSHRRALYQGIAAAAPKAASNSDSKELDAFIQRYYEYLPIEDLGLATAEDLAGAAFSHYQLLKSHLGEPLVRVLNPSFEVNGWHSAHTVIELVADDQPWLVSSVRSAMTRWGHRIHSVLHPIAHDTNGKAKSLIHVEIDAIPTTEHEALANDIGELFSMLDSVRMAGDEMFTTLQDTGKTLEIAEQRDFIGWLNERQFACLGQLIVKVDDRGDTYKVEKARGLFALEDATSKWKTDDVIATQLPQHDFKEKPLLIYKGNRRSPVMRDEHVDVILLPINDSNGVLESVVITVGLFVFGLQNEAVSNIPWMRERFQRVVEASGAGESSHDGKAIASTLRSLPRDMLMQNSSKALLDMSLGIVALQERQQVKLFHSTDPLGRFCNCLVFIPREDYSRELRLNIEEILKTHADGVSASFDMRLSSETSLARLHFVIQRHFPLERRIDWPAIEQRIRRAAISWTDSLDTTLRERHDEISAIALTRKYCNAFPVGYTEDYSPRAAAADIEFIEEHLSSDAPVMSFYRHIVADTGTVNFKLFSQDNTVSLSDVIPVIENMGLRVESEHPFEIKRYKDSTVWIHEFTVQHNNHSNNDVSGEASANRIQDAFDKIWRGDVENDGFNQLMLDAALDWQQVVILRALCKYLLQLDVPFSQSYMIDSLINNVSITRLLVKLFETRFDPNIDDRKAADKTSTRIVAEINTALDEVSSLDEDRILNSYRNLIVNMSRTNAYRTDKEGNPRKFLSFKFDSKALDELPLPRPMAEIFVYSADVEGIHLRGGKVARGGLRWSDRREDFRTEVLGLMKAQMVKNAVIVPLGSKGGFYVKANLPVEREAMMNIVVNCYRTYLSGLLDITDNIVGDSVVPPADVVRHDEDDPYLVVAADKGTATFSDYANEVSAEYNFWLGDAFASGGSAGYDHKKMGITARGGWESVKRHFRNLGINTQAEDFTVAGVGDMAGDVFGNGMLLSEHIQLVAAFNHQHIFIDPTPDAHLSFQERKRLFELPRSSWSDYNAELISSGGGIFSRQDKEIKLSAEARKALGTTLETMTPTALISIILKAPVDLFWNGGIGTYVKASSETHSDAADRANDILRIDGNDLRCRVVGEGGNLGFTQRGRIEFARNGGLIYTDAIDNSAGVDCSDHEVNIKILLNAVVAADDLTLKQRDKLLESMTDEVATLVLADNYLQTQCIDLVSSDGSNAFDEQVRFMQHLESQNLLDRSIEFLPDTEECAERMAADLGLFRPEIAVLVSYSKMVMYQELMNADLSREPSAEPILHDYFPDALHKDYLKEINSHILKPEIINTMVTNELVNRMGPTFVFRMQQELNASVQEISAAFIIVRRIFRLPALWKSIESLDNEISSEEQYRMQILVRGLAERATHWLLRSRQSSEGISEMVSHFQSDLDELISSMPDCLAQVQRETLDQRINHFQNAGAPDTIAHAVARVVPLSSSLDIVEIAQSLEQPVKEIASIYFALGQHLELTWLRDKIGELKVSSHWHTLATAELRSDLHYQQRHLCAEVASLTDQSLKGAERVAAWASRNPQAMDKFGALVTELKAANVIDFAMLSLAVNEVHKLLRSDRPLAS